MPHAKRPTRGRYERAWHDGKASDGFTVNGWRRVTKGGYVRFCGGAHYHEEFAKWSGLWVFVELDDGFGINVNAWPDEPWKDRRAVLYCTNKTDWFSGDVEAASRESRRRPTRSCN